MFRRSGDEFFARQLRVAGRYFGLDASEFLPEAGLLLVEVYESFERDVDFHTGQERARGRFGNLGLRGNGDGLGACEHEHVTAMVIEQPGRRFVGDLHDDSYIFSGRHAHLAPDIAYCVDDLLEGAHVGFGVGVDHRVAGGRPWTDHDAVGLMVAVERLPNLLGNERHERMQEQHGAFHDAGCETERN